MVTQGRGSSVVTQGNGVAHWLHTVGGSPVVTQGKGVDHWLHRVRG